MKRTLKIGALLLLVSGACAEDIPGVPPPSAQVYFPIGVESVPASTKGDVLAVVSSNFDQRYNAGHLSTFDLDKLVALAKQAPAQGDSIRFQDDFGVGDASAVIGEVKVRQFGGDVLFVGGENGSPDRVFLAQRGRNVVTMTTLAPDGTLSCATDGVEPISALDCTPAYEVSTSADDPFPLAYAPNVSRAGATRGMFMVGHLLTRAFSATPINDLLLFDVAAYEARLAQEAMGTDFSTARSDGLPPDESMPFGRTLLANVGGLASIAWAPGALGLGSDGGVFLVAGSGRLAQIGGGLVMEPLSVQVDGDNLTVQRGAAIPLDLVSAVIETRGMQVDTSSMGIARRAYLSVRFAEGNDVDSFNAGLMIFDLEGEQIEMLSLFEVGEETTRPTLLMRPDGTRLVYLPDIRLNRIYILDVTADVPQLVGTIAGLARRQIDGEEVQVRGLASPAQMAVAMVGGAPYGFVSNFANSTLAVLDLTDPDPRKHRLIARLGRNIDAEGDMEQPK